MATGRFGKRSAGGPQTGRLLVILGGVIAGFVVVVLAIIAIGAATGSGGSGGSSTSAAGPSARSSSSSPNASASDIPVPKVSAATIAKLPRATTEGDVKAAPVNHTAPSEGRTVHIASQTVGFATPGGKPITVIPKTQIGAATWLPVLATRSGWTQVRLPSRPNGATAWVPSAGLSTATTTWSVDISLGAGKLTVRRGDTVRGTWTVGQGKDGTPTPTGQTFLLSGFVDPQQNFSPVIYALGAHSATLDSYGGGPGTVAVHGWPTQAGRVGKVSHGCVRVPAAALAMFAKLPTGTPVDIVA